METDEHNKVVENVRNTSEGYKPLSTKIMSLVQNLARFLKAIRTNPKSTHFMSLMRKFSLLCKIIQMCKSDY